MASDNGRFTLEAKPTKTDDILEPTYRYQMYDGGSGSTTDRKLLWVNTQEKREAPMCTAHLSDDGWTIIETEFSPALVAYSPDGRRTLEVGIGGGSPAWKPKSFCWTSAGAMWGRSWQCFFTFEQSPYFACRASSGERLILDLSRGKAFVTETQAPKNVVSAAIDCEKKEVTQVLALLSQHMSDLSTKLIGQEHLNENPLSRAFGKVHDALRMVGVHRMKNCIPYLREWESMGQYSSGGGPSEIFGSYEANYRRSSAVHSLKILDEVPNGFPLYSLATYGGALGLEEHVIKGSGYHGRADKIKVFNTEMNAFEVILLLGSPDFIECASFTKEIWEYDYREGESWATLKISWEKDSYGHTKYVMTSFEVCKPYWLASEDRSAQFSR